MFYQYRHATEYCFLACGCVKRKKKNLNKHLMKMVYSENHAQHVVTYKHKFITLLEVRLI